MKNLCVYLLTVCAVLTLCCSCMSRTARVATSGDEVYWLGADISSANGMNARGQRLLDFEGDSTYELTALMHRMGLNAARFRVWVNPGRGWGGGKTVVIIMLAHVTRKTCWQTANWLKVRVWRL